MGKDKYLEIAVSAAKRAGEIHKKYFASGVKVRTKSSPFDLLTVADTRAEKEIISIIKKRFPGHNFLAEENKYRQNDCEYKWIIDPLDGTNNFAHKIPIFCTSIALAQGEELILGVIYDAMRDELFSAQKGQGAFLNGKRIKVAQTDTLKQALLITGFYYDRGKKMSENLRHIKLFLEKNISGIRRFGSAALDLCYVACGRASGFWEFELKPWDFAAGKLIIEEAGGEVTGRYGEPVELESSFIVASNGRLHRKMLQVIK
ncbi:MAG: inositol monophosphatase [Candidatus Omnitrophica bacterium]|nr:inositol monophosphatase [Candidatus Omnitrophota bacterium]